MRLAPPATIASSSGGRSMAGHCGYFQDQLRSELGKSEKKLPRGLSS